MSEPSFSGENGRRSNRETPEETIARLESENRRLQQLIAHYAMEHPSTNGNAAESQRAMTDSRIVVWQGKRDSEQVTYSPQLNVLLGYAFSDPTPDLIEHIHPDDQTLYQEQMSALLTGKRDQERLEFRVRNNSGAWRWALSQGIAYRGADGAVERVSGILLDITDGKEAESALRRSEEQFRAISEASPVGVFVNDVSGSCNYVNPAYVRITGVPTEIALGRGWRQFVHPDDRERLLEEWKAAMERFYQGESFVFDTIRRNVRPDGDVRWVHLRVAAMYDDDGFCNGYVGTLQDVTDYRVAEEILRRSETRFKTLISHFPVGLIMVDEQQNVLLMNQEFCRLFGVAADPASFIGGSGEAVVKAFAPYFSDESILEEGLYRQVRDRETSTGEQLSLKEGCLLERDSIPIIQGSEYMGHLWLYRDITERVRQERERERLLQEMQERSEVDPLTSLPTETAFQHLLQDVRKAAQQTQECFAVALLEVGVGKSFEEGAEGSDRFSDEFGPTAGEDLVQEAARSLRHALRPTDSIGRIGKQAFAVILPRVDWERGLELRGRLKNLPALQQYRPPNSDKTVWINLVIGMAFFPEDSDNTQELLAISHERQNQDRGTGF